GSGRPLLACWGAFAPCSPAHPSRSLEATPVCRTAARWRTPLRSVGRCDRRTLLAPENPPVAAVEPGDPVAHSPAPPAAAPPRHGVAITLLSADRRSGSMRARFR